jgi:hypothetical protein
VQEHRQGRSISLPAQGEAPHPLAVNRIAPTGTTDIDVKSYAIRQQMIERYDEWKRTRGITPEDEVKVMAVLADAQANWLKAVEEADKDDVTTEDFVDLRSGDTLVADINAGLKEAVGEKKATGFFVVGLPMLLFSKQIQFLAAAP